MEFEANVPVQGLGRSYRVATVAPSTIDLIGREITSCQPHGTYMASCTTYIRDVWLVMNLQF